ncbi:MAG: thermonuclease family protein [Cyanobium sp.]
MVALLSANAASAATVISIGDGDTLRVRDGGQQVTIRLACIDAPEMAQAPYGARSRELLQRLAPVGAEVSLRVKTTDRYGRTVAEVFRGSENLNLSLVRQGGAFAFQRYLAQCHALSYLNAERQAEFQRIGVWATPGGITQPWDYRATTKGQPTAPAQRPARSPGTSPLGLMAIPSGGSRSPATGTSSAGGRHYCKNLTWQEAQQLLRQGHSYLDRDGDGEACEGRR